MSPVLEDLKEVAQFLEYNAPPAPNHYCGPEANCDMICEEFAEYSKLVNKLNRAYAYVSKLVGPRDRRQLTLLDIP